ncbi:MAG: citrate lyase subunit alpha, partial [Clostridiaceae bacterium]|nr:citrate lyase subunit alpha [Clostridiaceae bacterium]
MSKEFSDIKSAIKSSPLEDGMTVSFHHHLRNGDFVLNMVMAAIADLGYKDLTVNASAFFSCHKPLLEHIRRGVVSGLECNYMDVVLGEEISRG